VNVGYWHTTELAPTTSTGRIRRHSGHERASQDGVRNSRPSVPQGFPERPLLSPFTEAARKQHQLSRQRSALEGRRVVRRINAMPLASNATLAEFPIHILIWSFR
jgi:hypothetical protein